MLSRKNINDLIFGKARFEMGTLIEIFRERRAAGLSLPVVRPGTQRRHFTHVEDIVDGLILAGERGHGEFQIGAEESYSVLEVARLFGGPVEFLPQRLGDRRDSVLDTSRIRALGWLPRQRLADYVNPVGAESKPSDQGADQCQLQTN